VSGAEVGVVIGIVIDDEGEASFLRPTAVSASFFIVPLPSRNVLIDPARRATGRGVLVLGGVRVALKFGGEFRIALKINASL
jgi:hypothetical protein